MAATIGAERPPGDIAAIGNIFIPTQYANGCDRAFQKECVRRPITTAEFLACPTPARASAQWLCVYGYFHAAAKALARIRHYP
jgi:hypothetical protein